MFKHPKILHYLLSTLLLLCVLQQLLYAGQTMSYSIGSSKQKNDNSFMQWGNLSGDTTDLNTFLFYDSLVLQQDIVLCDQAAVAGFDLVILYQDTAVLRFELKINKITDEIKENINELPKVNRIIIDNIKICCTANGKELIRPSKLTATYIIIQDQIRIVD